MSWWLIVSPSGLFTIGAIYASIDDAEKIRDAVWYAEDQRPDMKPILWRWSQSDGRWIPR